MKIRPTDSLPPEPEEIKEKKGSAFSEIEDKSQEPEAASRVKQNKGVSTEVLSALRGAKDNRELGERFVDLALSDLHGSIPAGDLDRVRSFLQEQTQEDPLIQNKLERISSLLTKTR